tara:strand:+ start:745 stop:930 length:186 start_codon:yes stop_codon:yes gene_type:complete
MPRTEWFNNWLDENFPDEEVDEVFEKTLGYIDNSENDTKTLQKIKAYIMQAFSMSKEDEEE